jgi:hypothetical protein
MLHPLGEDIWLAEGPHADVAGFRYPTRMAVVRLRDGGLFVWSPIAIGRDLQVAIDALGEVRFLVAPNSLHHLFLAEWRERYPGAGLIASPGLRAKRADLSFDGDLTDKPHPAWASDIDQVVVRGNLITTEVVFFHRASRSVLFTDLIQHFSPAAFKGWRAVVARLDLMTAPQPETPRKFRTAFVDRRAARAALERILAWPCERVVMAHAEPIASEGQAFIARTFRWLLR